MIFMAEKVETGKKPKTVKAEKQPKQEKADLKKVAAETAPKGKETAQKNEGVSAKTVPVIVDAYSVIRFVLMTEKSIQNIEKENKLVFIVNRASTKKQIRDAVNSAFSTSVSSVRTAIDQKSRKKAFVKFTKPGEAGDIAVKLGII